jgi:hypothetical protein
MLKLSKRLLQRGLSATLHHGYGSFLPEPPELEIVKENWSEIKAELSEIDLDEYMEYTHLWSFKTGVGFTQKGFWFLNSV